MSDAPMAYFDDNGRAIFRASAIANCEAALVHSLRGVEPQSPPESMQRRFNDGYLHEPAILEHLRTLGWTVKQSQDTVEVKVNESISIVGHVDGIAENKGNLRAVVEAKALSDSGYKKWVKEGFAGFPRYAMQATIYMQALQLPMVYAVKNKNSGEISVQMVEAPPFLLAKLKAKAIRVTKMAGTNKTPDCPKVFDYPCAYYPLHPDRGGHVTPVDDPNELRDELNDVCSQYQSAQARVKDWKEKAEELRVKLIEEVGEASEASSSLYQIKKTVVRSRRLDTGKLRASFPDLSQFEVESESVRLEVKARTDI